MLVNRKSRNLMSARDRTGSHEVRGSIPLGSTKTIFLKQTFVETLRPSPAFPKQTNFKDQI